MAFRAEDVAKLFALDGEPMLAVPFGHGHINDTYFVETSRARKYIFKGLTELYLPICPAL